jgi:hypothetical protein
MLKYVIRKECKAGGKRYKPGDEWIPPDDGKNYSAFIRHYVKAVPVAEPPARKKAAK